MPKTYIIAGLGWGDEGKGTTVEYLTRREKASLVVRYNGGAQAAHNVVLDDGRHHTFSQFGSGTLHGAATHLSRFMVMDPVALRNEATALRNLGVSNAFDQLTVERGALLITPYQRGANRIRELLRSGQKHGSCGVGVGETVSDHLTYGTAVPMIDDLSNRAVLGEKLSFIRSLKLKEFSKTSLMTNPPPDGRVQAAFKMLTMSVKDVVDMWLAAGEDVRLVGEGYLQEVLGKDETVIFEGAQGVLLDQNWGFHPHTTWSDISFRNAYTLLGETAKNREVESIGVIRTYATRHGAGPFPTEVINKKFEVSGEFEEKFNETHPWQGRFRVGYLDLVLLRYALDAIEPDTVALTHMDRISCISQMCVSYRSNDASGWLEKFMAEEGRLRLKIKDEDLRYQSDIGKLLQSTALQCNYWPVNDDFVEVLQDLTGIEVSILSYGPTYQDKVCR